MRLEKIRIIFFTALLSVFVLNGCGQENTQKSSVAAEKTEKKQIVIFAASSLGPLLNEMNKQYQIEYPNTKIVLNTASTQMLKTQIEQGAKADLFMAARESDIKDLEEKGLIKQFSKFAGNHLEIVASKEGAKKIKNVADLALPNNRIILADQTVPVGQYSIRLLENLQGSGLYSGNLLDNIKKDVVSYENSEQAVLGKIVNGEADAGVVFRSSYKTSIANKQPITAIPFASKYNFETYYYLGEVKNGDKDVQTFTKWLQSTKARKIIEKFGLENL